MSFPPQSYEQQADGRNGLPYACAAGLIGKTGQWEVLEIEKLKQDFPILEIVSRDGSPKIFQLLSIRKFYSCQ